MPETQEHVGLDNLEPVGDKPGNFTEIPDEYKIVGTVVHPGASEAGQVPPSTIGTSYDPSRQKE